MSKPNGAALEFSHLFSVDDCDDGLDVYTEEFRRPVAPDPPHPFEKFFHPELQASGVSDVSWDEPLTKAAEPKPFTNPLNFSKGSIGFKLQVTRVEHKTHDDGEKWAYAFSGDELVDAHLIRE